MLGLAGGADALSPEGRQVSWLIDGNVECRDRRRHTCKCLWREHGRVTRAKRVRAFTG